MAYREFNKVLVPIRLAPKAVEAVDGVAKAAGVSRAAVLRWLIRRGGLGLTVEKAIDQVKTADAKGEL